MLEAASEAHRYAHCLLAVMVRELHLMILMTP